MISECLTLGYRLGSISLSIQATVYDELIGRSGSFGAIVHEEVPTEVLARNPRSYLKFAPALLYPAESAGDWGLGPDFGSDDHTNFFPLKLSLLSRAEYFDLE